MFPPINKKKWKKGYSKEVKKKLCENRVKALEYEVQKKKRRIEEIKAYLDKYFD